jgi:hypothetical protein
MRLISTRQHTAINRRMQGFRPATEGYLSQMHHNRRGLPKRRYQVWSVLHNFDCRVSDGSTPASRFFRREFPNLFETVNWLRASYDASRPDNEK